MATARECGRPRSVILSVSAERPYLAAVDLVKLTDATLRDYKLLSRGDSVLVGLSGGADSVALLHILLALSKKWKLRVGAAHVDHDIRGDSSIQDRCFCENLCNTQNIEFHWAEVDIPKLARDSGLGLEEAGREFRYEFFDEIARAEGYDRIALGHHADDQVETVLFRLFRGTGTDGLLGIPIEREKIIRPLLQARKSDILDYLSQNKLSFCTDETNLDSTFQRNFIRNELLPLVRERANPKVDEALLNLVENARPEQAYLESIVKKAARRAVKLTPGGKLNLALDRLARYDDWVWLRLLRRCVRIACGSHATLDREALLRLFQLAQTGNGKVSLPLGLTAVAANGQLVLSREAIPRFQCDLPQRGSVEIPVLAMRVSVGSISPERVPNELKPRACKVYLDYDVVEPPLRIRSIKPGDRFRPLGVKGTRKVSDYLTDRKVPSILRDEVPVVCDRQGIVWLVGWEIDERVKLTGKTRKVWTIGYRIVRTAQRASM